MSRLGSARVLALFALGLAGCAAAAPRLRPFKTDGCSLSPDGALGRKKLWLHCCEEHDRSYWLGGTKPERLAADLALHECVAAVERPKTAGLMYTGTHAGGTPYLPTSFRWGYGWRYPRAYRPHNDRERTLIEESTRK